MFSITTIASSTTMPVASTMPKSVSTLIEKSNSLMNANVPISDTGMVIAGMIVLRQFCRNRNITRMTRPIASSSVHSTSMIDSRTTTTLSNATCHSRPGGKFCLRRSISATTPLEHLDRVGRRQQRNADALRLEAEEAQVRRIRFGAELDAADVLDAHQRAVLAGLDDDVLELRRFRQAAHRANADGVGLLGRRRRIAERARGHLHVLLAQRAQHVAAVMLRPASLVGSSHSRIANLRSPNTITSPTPGTRLIASRM